MNDLQIFENSEFGKIRTITKDNEPMFCLADVCKALELTNSRSVADRLEDDERCKLDLPRQGETWFVTESGLYAVILRSDKPNAKKFRKWVTGEVLPSIRKNGGYIANQENLTPEQIVANALVVAQNIITQKDKQIEEMTPKANYFDALVDKKLNTNIRDTAKELGVGEKSICFFSYWKRICFQTGETQTVAPICQIRRERKRLVCLKGQAQRAERLDRTADVCHSKGKRNIPSAFGRKGVSLLFRR